MKRIGTLVIGTVAATFTAGIAQAGAPDDSWYIAPSLYALWLDDSRLADDDLGISLAFGRTLSPAWDLELSVFGSEHQRAGNGNLELQGLAANTKRVFYRDGRVNPFLNFGVGYTKNIFKPGEDREDFDARFSAGVLVDLGPAREDGTGMQLRADLGARRAMSSNSPVDYIAGIGIQYAWGGATVRKVVDSDGDGVPDDLDRCPGTAAGTAVDANGCPLDDDGDGVANDLDKCPGTPAGAKVDAVGCEPDSDGDGVGDGRDQCPNTSPGAKVDEKGCETDGDADGIVDSQDKCPDTPKGERVDATGCPFNKELLLQGVKFETNSAALLPESMPVLDRAVATLKRYPELKVEIAGHTDSRGSDAYNLDLSARRAATVLEYLKAGGASNELTSHGYGEGQPIASNNTEDGRQQNRRVVLRALN